MGLRFLGKDNAYHEWSGRVSRSSQLLRATLGRTSKGDPGDWSVSGWNADSQLGTEQ